MTSPRLPLLWPAKHVSDMTISFVRFTQGGETTTHSPGVFTLASESLNELVLLSKKLDFVRDPPRVVRVRGAASRESSRLETPQVAEDGGEATRGVRTPHIDTSLISSSAGAAWQAQQVLDSRLKREWREGQGRAAEALYSLVDSDRGGMFDKRGTRRFYQSDDTRGVIVLTSEIKIAFDHPPCHRCQRNGHLRH